MPDDNFSQFATKKAYEISYAIFRVSGILKNGSLAKQLEDQALKILSTAILKDYAECRLVLNSIEYLLRLGTDVNLINPANSYLVINEIGNFNSAIAEFENTAKLPDLNLEPIFSKKPIPVDNMEKVKREHKEDNKKASEETSIDDKASIRAAIRQSAILERIRQFGNCRLKDIQEFLPDVSDRTVRYDLQTLIEQGLIEKVGTAGLSSHYQIKGFTSQA
ncbi:MAG: DeoR family transcriptional regulator [Candidatus Liptonbacteria bacterium]|nr:DeoR family transcriptional regulator [Candidatus Liptonbacteria bacterium]